MYCCTPRRTYAAKLEEILMFLRKEKLPATVLGNYSLKEDESKIAFLEHLEDEANVIKAWLVSVLVFL